jgi:hypothetical protein
MVLLSDMISAVLFTSLRPLWLSLLDVEENKQGHNREDTKANWVNIHCHVAAGEWFHLKQICGLVCICCLPVSHLVLIGVVCIGTNEWLCIYPTNRRRTAGVWWETFTSVLVKSFNRSWTRDFLRFQPDFTHFQFFQTIQHVKHVLTRKIVRFYELKRNFNNLDLANLFY